MTKHLLNQVKLQDPSKSKSTAVMNLTQLSTGLRQDIAALIRDKPIRSSKPAWSARGESRRGEWEKEAEQRGRSCEDENIIL